MKYCKGMDLSTKIKVLHVYRSINRASKRVVHNMLPATESTRGDCICQHIMSYIEKYIASDRAYLVVFSSCM